MAKDQLADGNDFLVEYHAGMRPTSLEFLTQARRDGQAFEVAGPTCEWVSKDDNKVHRGAVAWITSSGAVAQDLKLPRTDPELRRKSVTHSECKLETRYVNRVSEGLFQAYVIPPKVMKAVSVSLLKRLRTQNDPLAQYAFEAGPVPEEADIYDPWTLEVADDMAYFWDDVHGGELDKGEVTVARKEELQWMEKRKVFKIVPDMDMNRRRFDLHRSGGLTSASRTEGTVLDLSQGRSRR